MINLIWKQENKEENYKNKVVIKFYEALAVLFRCPELKFCQKEDGKKIERRQEFKH